MPPESLSTMAVMKPGPRTARKTRKCRRHRLRNPAILSLPQNRYDVVGSDYARERAVFLQHRQGKQIVFVEHFGDALLRLVGARGNQPPLRQAAQGTPRIAQKKARRRYLRGAAAFLN